MENYENAICEYIKIMQTDQESYKYFCERGIKNYKLGKYFAELGSD